MGGTYRGSGDGQQLSMGSGTGGIYIYIYISKSRLGDGWYKLVAEEVQRAQRSTTPVSASCLPACSSWREGLETGRE